MPIEKLNIEAQFFLFEEDRLTLLFRQKRSKKFHQTRAGFQNLYNLSHLLDMSTLILIKISN